MNAKSLLLLFTLLAGLTSFLLMITSLERPESDTTEQASSDKILELFAENIKTLRFGPSGQIDQIFTAGQITQYQSEAYIAVSNLQLESFRNAIPNWKIKSNTGQYLPEGIIVLHRDINAEQLESDQNIRISTDQLSINEITGIVSTDQPVIMTSKSGTLNALGMTFDLNEEVIQFEADIIATYEPGYE